MNANWITSPVDFNDAASVFIKKFNVSADVRSATLTVTGVGVYNAHLNGERVGKFIMAPGWTDYRYRLQVQTYDITDLLKYENRIEITVGKGWYRSPMPFRLSEIQKENMKNLCGITAEIIVSYATGKTESIITDESWTVEESPVRYAEIYGGEVFDATFKPDKSYKAVIYNGPRTRLVKQQGEEVTEQERLSVARMFVTPKGETVLDFGQEFTGYPELSVTAARGDKVKLSFGEVLDKDGNFYNENYRAAKCLYEYTCKDGCQKWHPEHTFYSFRYARVDEFPGGVKNVSKENFTGIAVYSAIKRTGYIKTSNPKLNRLIDNVFWGQRCNFLDVPTDCPQRDERLGWTGDAQVFARSACINFDCEKFFTKWLADIAVCQRKDGFFPQVVPDVLGAKNVSAAWEDVATIAPWEVYMAYGNPKILKKQFDSMCKWVDYITSVTTTPNLWTGGDHHGDWLGLDAPQGDRKGASDDFLIASAYYAYSTSLVVKAGKVLGRDVSRYEELYHRIKAAFQSTYTEYKTQTECVVAAYFDLAPNPEATVKQLVDMLEKTGHLTTGFVGTPYLLPVLSRYGYTKKAYDLLLREEFPSWLYCVNCGATTIWEHWDSQKPDGTFWDVYMNSFNHYAYGSVIEWIYRTAGGICTVEEYPGYERVKITPHPDERLDWMIASIDTRHGKITSEWRKTSFGMEYIIDTPVKAQIEIAGKSYSVPAGKYHYFS